MSLIDEKMSKEEYERLKKYLNSLTLQKGCFYMADENGKLVEVGSLSDEGITNFNDEKI